MRRPGAHAALEAMKQQAGQLLGRSREMLGHDRKFTVNKDKLLDTLKKNRDTHIEEFKVAKEGYRKVAAEALAVEAQKAEMGEKFTMNFHDIPRPINHKKDYDQIIGLLEMEISDTMQITTSDYQQFVLDNWGWKQEHGDTYSNYAIGGAALPKDPDEDDSE